MLKIPSSLLIAEAEPEIGNRIVGTEGDDTIYGTDGDDTILGFEGNDRIYGLAGSDILVGGSGANRLDGGDGADTVNYRDQNFGVQIYLYSGVAFHDGFQDQIVSVENADGSFFDDVIHGDSSGNILRGFGGNDLLYGYAGDDILQGGDGDDILVGGSGANEYIGGAGFDTIDYSFGAFTDGIEVDLRTQIIANNGYGTAEIMSGIEAVVGGSRFVDVVYGNAQANVIEGGSNDLIVAFGGDDTLRIAGAPSQLNGGNGIDTFEALQFEVRTDPENSQGGIFVERATGIIIDLGAGEFISDGFDGSGEILKIENVTGSVLNDIIRGDAGSNHLVGLNGDDFLQGRNGDDYLFGELDNDVLLGGKGDDILDGFLGFDTASYMFSLAPVSVSLIMSGRPQDTGEGMDTLVSIEGLVGSKFADLLKGDSGANAISGLAGDDTLYGNTGHDMLDGGDGNDQLFGQNNDDTLLGGRGDDLLSGGFGTDTASYFGATGGVTVSLATQNVAQDTGNEGMDTLVSIENLNGTAHSDTLSGNGSDNWLVGLGGNDRLIGGNGSDTMNGGAGSDILFGGGGNDTMIGGNGADYFNFADGHLGSEPGSTDTILDFSQVQDDMIRLTGIDADTTTGGDQAFVFIGEAGFSNTAGEMRYYHANGHTYLEMDTDGDGKANIYLDLKGYVDLTQDDFFL